MSCTPVSRPSLAIVAALLLIFVAQCFWFIRTQSFTNDEPEHIIAGLEAWHYGEFKHWHDQPPLGRLLFTLPLLSTDWQYKMVDDQVQPVSPSSEVWLNRSRPVVTLFGVALLILLWLTARRLFSEAAAHFSLALAALSPELVAHFSVSTIDGIGALFVFAAVVQWMRYWRDPSRSQAALLAGVLGLLLLSKFNSPPLMAVLLLLVLTLAPGRLALNPRGLQWRRTLAILLGASLIVWAGYFFHVSQVTFAHQAVTIHFPGYTKLLQYEMPTLARPITIFLPACEWLTGFGMVVAHNMEGHRSFFLGQYPNAGLKLYFPVAMALKWPLIILTLGLAGLIATLRGARLPLSRKRSIVAIDSSAATASPDGSATGYRDLLLMSLIPAIYLFFAITARINIGVRHVLPLYPFLLLYAAAFFEAVRRSRIPWRQARLVFAALLIAHTIDIARYAPDYLSYFTIAVPPNQSWRLLADSNTDWGQGMYALRDFQLYNSSRPLHLAYVGEVPPEFYGITYQRLKEGDRPTGLVAVSATHLSGQLLKDHHAYRWLLYYPLRAVLNHSIYVFEVPASH